MSPLWLPESLYRSLPVLYGIAGLTLLITFRGNAPAALSATLLIGAGMIVGLWRFRHRTASSSSVSAREAFYRRKRRASSLDTTTF